MKLCPKCGLRYPDDANFCPKDAGHLIDAADDGGEVTPIEAGVQTGGDAPGGRVIGDRFVLGESLGGGLTGEAMRATDRQTGAACAVKLVDPAVFPNSLLLQRSERELKQLARIDHPGIARVLGHGREDDTVWIATELVTGVSLHDLVHDEGPLPAARACKLMLVIGQALAEAAKAGVIHRDLAPKNALVTPGDGIKLINFTVPVPALSANAKSAGVPEYMAPEMIEGKPVDQRSNIYSLGAVFYFALTGNPPFSGDPDQIYAQVLDGQPHPPSELVELPAALADTIDKLVIKAMARAARNRYMTLRQLLGDLEGTMTGGGDAGATQPMGRAGIDAQLGAAHADTVEAATLPPEPQSTPALTGAPAAPVAASAREPSASVAASESSAPVAEAGSAPVAAPGSEPALSRKERRARSRKGKRKSSAEPGDRATMLLGYGAIRQKEHSEPDAQAGGEPAGEPALDPAATQLGVMPRSPSRQAAAVGSGPVADAPADTAKPAPTAADASAPAPAATADASAPAPAPAADASAPATPSTAEASGPDASETAADTARDLTAGAAAAADPGAAAPAELPPAASGARPGAAPIGADAPAKKPGGTTRLITGKKPLLALDDIDAETAPEPAAPEPAATIPGSAPVMADAAATTPAPTEPAAPSKPARPARPATTRRAKTPRPGSKGHASRSRRGGEPSKSKGKFRETLWFKKGELDAQAAAEAEEIRRRTGKDIQDRADFMPMEDRYSDDGTLTDGDEAKFSLKTGDTNMMAAFKDRPSPSASTKISEKELIEEMKRGRGAIIAAIAVGALLVIAVIIYAIASSGSHGAGDEPAEPAKPALEVPAEPR